MKGLANTQIYVLFDYITLKFMHTGIIYLGIISSQSELRYID